jgi:hypothetical protein
MSRLKRGRPEQPALALFAVAAEEQGEAAPSARAAKPESGGPASQSLTEPKLAMVQPVALTLASGQSITGRYLGLMLFYPALQVARHSRVRAENCCMRQACGAG